MKATIEGVYRFDLQKVVSTRCYVRATRAAPLLRTHAGDL